MKNIEKFIEFFFSLSSLIIAKIVAELFFDGSFKILLILYVIMAMIGLWISDLVSKKNKSSWRIVLVVIFSLIFVFSVYGILWALGLFDGSTLKIMIAIVLGSAFVFLMGAIALVVDLGKNNKER